MQEKDSGNEGRGERDKGVKYTMVERGGAKELGQRRQERKRDTLVERGRKRSSESLVRGLLPVRRPRGSVTPGSHGLKISALRSSPP